MKILLLIILLILPVFADAQIQLRMEDFFHFERPIEATGAVLRATVTLEIATAEILRISTSLGIVPLQTILATDTIVVPSLLVANASASALNATGKVLLNSNDVSITSATIGSILGTVSFNDDVTLNENLTITGITVTSGDMSITGSADISGTVSSSTGIFNSTIEIPATSGNAFIRYNATTNKIQFATDSYIWNDLN